MLNLPTICRRSRWAFLLPRRRPFPLASATAALFLTGCSMFGGGGSGGYIGPPEYRALIETTWRDHVAPIVEQVDGYAPPFPRTPVAVVPGKEFVAPNGQRVYAYTGNNTGLTYSEWGINNFEVRREELLHWHLFSKGEYGHPPRYNMVWINN